MAGAGTCVVRFLVMSDTHTQDLFPPDDSTHAFRESLPKADVLLHCGDLTMVGDLREYQTTLGMLSKVDAELKLVIAGNHDLTLDKHYWNTKRHREDDPEAYDKAMDMWTGDMAKKANVKYLEEGHHTFILKSGATFTVYASPFQPEFCGWAFPYPRHEDRYNPANLVTSKAKSITQIPIPDFPAVDIIMTHGPPFKWRDKTWENQNVGCPHLLRAVQRAKPRMHCFGHIHEGWGAHMVAWRRQVSSAEEDHVHSAVEIPIDHEKMVAEKCVKIDISSRSTRRLLFGEKTLMVNAAIMNADYPYKPTNAPFLVDLDLPVLK